MQFDCSNSTAAVYKAILYIKVVTDDNRLIHLISSVLKEEPLSRLKLYNFTLTKNKLKLVMLVHVRPKIIFYEIDLQNITTFVFLKCFITVTI